MMEFTGINERTLCTLNSSHGRNVRYASFFCSSDTLILSFNYNLEKVISFK